MNFADDTTIFFGNINCFAKPKPILKVYEKASSSKMIFSKSWASRTRTYDNRTDKLGKMIKEINHERWSKSFTKILEIHVRNSTLNNNDHNKINDHIHTKIIFGTGWDSVRGRITKPPTTDRPPTTDNRSPTHQQLFHQPTDSRQPTTDPTKGLPLTHRPPNTNPLNTNPLTHRPTDKIRTDPPTTDFKTVSILIFVTITFCVCYLLSANNFCSLTHHSEYFTV